MNAFTQGASVVLIARVLNGNKKNVKQSDRTPSTSVRKLHAVEQNIASNPPQLRHPGNQVPLHRGAPFPLVPAATPHLGAMLQLLNDGRPPLGYRFPLQYRNQITELPPHVYSSLESATGLLRHHASIRHHNDPSRVLDLPLHREHLVREPPRTGGRGGLDALSQSAAFLLARGLPAHVLPIAREEHSGESYVNEEHPLSGNRVQHRKKLRLSLN